MFVKCFAPKRSEHSDRELSQAAVVDASLKKLSLDPSSMSSPDAKEDGAQFLIELDRFAEMLHIKAASRAYRKDFTRNYRCLFKDFGRQYRFELLQAMVQECPSIHINGNRYDFSSSVVDLSRKTVSILKDIAHHLGFYKPSHGEDARGMQLRSQIIRLLVCLDSAWAEFECLYIKELIHIETAGRNPLLVAAKYAKSIPRKDADSGYISWCTSLEKCKTEQKLLFGRIAELNVMANVARKGRGDMNENALKVAIDVLTPGSGYEDSNHLVRSVCEDLLESFDAMCQYLCVVDRSMESVDPILTNNSGLVERLADLEESWEMVSRYVEDESMRSTLDVLFRTLKKTQNSDLVFREMCCDCDVEVFLVIPRLLLLAYVTDPTKDALMKRLLPHACEGIGACDLQGLVEKFESLVLKDTKVVETLRFQAVHQGSPTLESVDFIPPEMQELISSFMRDLEGWSMELQRRDARDWNSFCALLVHHLSPDYKKDRKIKSSV